MKKKVFIFDIDGTIADNEHRIHHITLRPKNYKVFYQELIKDKAIEDVVELCNTLHKNYQIILLTGRPEDYRTLCEKWLKENNIQYDILLMRKQNDFRPDNIIKEEIYHNEIEQHYKVIGIFEDRNRCVDMWRKLGLTCYQPRELAE